MFPVASGDGVVFSSACRQAAIARETKISSARNR
jgi:hypothetical protein